MTDLTTERYINPYTDFGFKKLFGTEMNKDLLISFLNALPSSNKMEIEDVQYLNSGIYYSTFAIREQAPKGLKWDYRLEDVYTVGVLNFKFPDGEYPADKFVHEIKLKDVEGNHVFYNKLTFLYLEMPKFNKREDELLTMFDKWMYVLRNLSRLLERPKALQDRVFQKVFEQAEIAQYTPEERREYEASVKNYWDYYSTMKTAVDKAKTEGRAEGAPPVPRQPSGAVKSPEDSSLVIRSDEGAEMILVIIRRGSLAAEVIWNAAYAAQGVFRQPPAVFTEILRKQLQIGFDL